MLWDIIRDFFVQFIFGGFTSDGRQFNGFIGLLNVFEDGYFSDNYELLTSTALFQSPVLSYESDLNAQIAFISVGDWLSTTATIIVLIGVCWFFWLFIKYMFKAGAGLFKW